MMPVPATLCFAAGTTYDVSTSYPVFSGSGRAAVAGTAYAASTGCTAVHVMRHPLLMQTVQIVLLLLFRRTMLGRREE